MATCPSNRMLIYFRLLVEWTRPRECHSIDTRARDNSETRGEFAMTFNLRRLFVSIFLAGIFTNGVAQHLDSESGSLEPGRAATAAAERRVIALQGQTNFRDLGGYET